MEKSSGGPKKSVIAIFVFPVLAILSACQSGPPKISIQGARAQLSPAIYGEAMVTMTINNQGGADVLNGVSVDIPGARAMLHVMKDKVMTEAGSVRIPGGKQRVFQMGGSHIMIEGMPRSMAAGSAFTITLRFEKSGEKKLHLTLEKAPSAPMAMPMS